MKSRKIIQFIKLIQIKKITIKRIEIRTMRKKLEGLL